MLKRTGLLKLYFPFCRTQGTHGIDKECTQDLCRKLERNHTHGKDLNVDGKIILKWNLQN
jgi:hypothetical protein